MNQKNIEKKLTKFIKQQLGNKPAVIGLSGGIDSALVAYLAVKTLGNKKVYGLIMPSLTNTQEDLKLAKVIAKNLNIKFSVFNIEKIIKQYQKETKLFKQKTSLGNLKARTRMSILYGKANELGGIVLGTGNKSELMAGYFTKHGDGGVDILPIGDLYKTDVKKLASYLNIPKEIIDRPPTAGLWAGQTDEAEMGISYEKLDQILEAIEKRKNLSKFNKKDVEKVKKMIKNSEHKRRLPPIPIHSDPPAGRKKSF